MGGLTVMRALQARLPHESFVYLGDTARLPYGTKSADTVTRYAVQATRRADARRHQDAGGGLQHRLRRGACPRWQKRSRRCR